MHFAYIVLRGFHHSIHATSLAERFSPQNYFNNTLLTASKNTNLAWGTFPNEQATVRANVPKVLARAHNFDMDSGAPSVGSECCCNLWALSPTAAVSFPTRSDARPGPGTLQRRENREECSLLWKEDISWQVIRGRKWEWTSLISTDYETFAGNVSEWKSKILRWFLQIVLFLEKTFKET